MCRWLKQPKLKKNFNFNCCPQILDISESHTLKCINVKSVAVQSFFSKKKKKNVRIFQYLFFKSLLFRNFPSLSRHLEAYRSRRLDDGVFVFRSPVSLAYAREKRRHRSSLDRLIPSSFQLRLWKSTTSSALLFAAQ